MKKLLILFVLVQLTQPVFAENYKCKVTKRTDETSKGEVTWSGEIKLKSTIDAKVFIIGNTPIELEEIVQKNPTQAGFQKTMSKYDGQLLVGLAAVDGVLKLSQGVVDSSKKNMGPHEAIAWADLAAKKIGVKNFTRKLEIECEK